MKKILVGTGNSAKLNTYKQLLKGLDLELVSARDLNIPEPEENAPSFEQEAIAKAKYYYAKSDMPVIVDDGGFQIEALNGEPGIKSRRWVGREMSDEEIIAEVFKRMAGQANRACKYTIYVAIATPFGIYISDAVIAGVVPEKPSDIKTEGYPYDSVMYLPNYKKYWVEVHQENNMNPRAHALGKLKDILRELAKS